MAPAQKQTTTRIAAVCGAALFVCGRAQAVDNEAACAGSGCASTGDDVQLLQQFRSKGRDSVKKFGHLVAEPGSWKEWLEQNTASKDNGKLSMLQEETYQSCFLNESDCSLASMNGKPTLVYPGGGTKCINGDEYAFAVVPGDEDKLLYYFEGGGACWEANGAYGKQVAMQCTDSLAYGIYTTGFGNGVQDWSDERNPFRTYSVVEPIYCAGDAFMGNTTMELDGKILPQTGYYNAKAVMEWTQKNFQKELSSFVIMGYSAGTLGTMAWSDTLLSTFSYKKAAVIMDSYAALFPSGTQGATISRWGACDTPLFPADLQAQCKEKKLTVQAVLASTMSKFPSVPFGSIQSKVDGTQVWFYKGMAQTWGMESDMGLTDPQFYEGTNKIFEGYSGGFPNYVIFLVNGAVHCYTQAPTFYTASAVGESSDASQGHPMMYQWVQDLVGEATGSTECDGKLMPNNADGDTYCDELLVPKEVQTAKALTTEAA